MDVSLRGSATFAVRSYTRAGDDLAEGATGVALEELHSALAGSWAASVAEAACSLATLRRRALRRTSPPALTRAARFRLRTQLRMTAWMAYWIPKPAQTTEPPALVRSRSGSGQA